MTRTARPNAQKVERPESPGREWRPVVGEPLYEVSNDGLVWSTRTARPLKAHPQKRGGHLRVELNGAIVRKHLVHVLVARAFLGEPPEGQQVCHNDGDPTHNNVRNLRYGTPSENMADKLRHGTNPGARKTHGDCGHELKAPNLVAAVTRRSGNRNCRACGCGRIAAHRAGITDPVAIKLVTDRYYEQIMSTGSPRGVVMNSHIAKQAA